MGGGQGAASAATPDPAPPPTSDGNGKLETASTVATPTLGKASTLFRVKIKRYINGASPIFYTSSDTAKKQPLKAAGGAILSVHRTDGTDYLVSAEDTLLDCASTQQICPGQLYRTDAALLDDGIGLIRDSLVSGVLVVPFKYYPSDHSFSSSSVSVAPYFGYETDRFFGSTLGLVQKYTAFAALGPSIVTVAQPGQQSTNVFALSAALGLGFDINKQVKFIFAVGKDWTGSSGVDYKYRAKPWLAATLGYSF